MCKVLSINSLQNIAEETLPKVSMFSKKINFLGFYAVVGTHKTAQRAKYGILSQIFLFQFKKGSPKNFSSVATMSLLTRRAYSTLYPKKPMKKRIRTVEG